MVVSGQGGSVTGEQLTPYETVEEMRRLSELRLKPIIVELDGRTIGEALNEIIDKKEPQIAEREAYEGEADRYADFMERWGIRFRSSIVGRSIIAWQMHVCRLPVFRPDETGVSRAKAYRLLKTRDARMIVAWFRRLGAEERWDLCEEFRDQRSAGRAQRKKKTKTITTVVSERP